MSQQATDSESTTSVQKQRQHPKSQRRPHRKSRNGCAECKRRHIRCDERRPACANCAIAERACVFASPRAKITTRAASSSSSSSSLASPAESRHRNLQVLEQLPSFEQGATPSSAHHSHENDTPVRTPASDTPLPPPPPLQPQHQHQTSRQSSLPSFGESFPTTLCDSESPPFLPDSESGPSLFTAEHLSLLYHAFTHQCEMFMSPGSDQRLVDIAIRRASDAPYLIDQVLAISALHQSSLQPPQSPHATSLHHLATSLQTRAVALFTRQAATVSPNDHDASVPRFLFAATLSLHDLGDTLRSIRDLPTSQFHILVNRFVDCFRIHHGVRAVIGPIWTHLLQSEIEPLLSLTRDFREKETEQEPDPSGPLRRGDECRPLTDLLKSSDLGPSTLSACHQAIERLQWSFDLFCNIPAPMAGPHAASAFSVTVGKEFLLVLRRLQPEALVILAYYGVLLHYGRHFWLFGEAGREIVAAVARHLGGYWEGAMAWPLDAVRSG